jgi:hypothetical protein
MNLVCGASVRRRHRRHEVLRLSMWHSMQLGLGVREEPRGAAQGHIQRDCSCSIAILPHLYCLGLAEHVNL